MGALVYHGYKLYGDAKLECDKIKVFGYTLLDSKVNRGVIFGTGYVNENIKKIYR